MNAYIKSFHNPYPFGVKKLVYLHGQSGIILNNVIFQMKIQANITCSALQMMHESYHHKRTTGSLSQGIQQVQLQKMQKRSYGSQMKALLRK